MGNHGSAALDRDRAFDIGSLNELLTQGRKVLAEAVRLSGEMEKSVSAVSRTYKEIDGGYRVGALGADISALKGKLETGLYRDTIDKMEKILNKLINDIPAYDSALAGDMDGIREVLSSIRGRIAGLDSLLQAGDVSLSYQEFRSRLEDMKGGWDEATQDLEAVLAEIEGDMLGVAVTATVYSQDPVNLSTGNFVYDHEDLKIGGEIPLSFHRYYNAKDRTKGSLGRCFVHNHEIRLEADGEKGRVTVTMADGQKKTFRKQADGTYLGSHSVLETLTEDPDGYCLENREGGSIRFHKNGQMARMENRNGRGISFFHDGNGRLEKAVTDNGDSLSYAYNEAGQLIRVSDHTGRSVTLSYERGKLSEVTDPEGNVRAYRYGKNGRIGETINPRGITAVKNTYDEKRRIIRQDFPDGGHMDYAYDDGSRQVILTERNGTKTTYIHDSRYRCTDIRYEDGTSEHYDYNRKNQCILHTDRNGNTTRMMYDGRGNLTQTVNALGEKTNLTYNGDGKLILLKINGKEKLHYYYDSKGNLLSAMGADQNETRITYDGQGRPVRMEHADKTATAITYDAKGNIETIRDSDGVSITYRYDGLNRVTASIDGNGNATAYEYDGTDRVTRVTDPLGASRSYRYNESGKVTHVTDYDGHTVEAAYNGIGKVSRLTDKEGNVTTFSYDKMWNTSEVIQPDGGITAYRYDGNNRLSREEMPGGSSVEYTYDGNGNRTGITDSTGAHTGFTYDALNRVTRVTDENGKETCYTYDGEGNIICVTDPDGNRTLYTYDGMKRCTGKTDALGNTTTYAYDAMGNVESIRYPDGTTETCRYQNGRPAEAVRADGNTIRYFYDGNGNCTAMEDSMGGRLSITYDALNRRKTLTNPDGGVVCYEYDALGNVTQMTDPNGNTTHYTYTPNGHLASVTDALGNRTAYAYDVMGHLTAVERTGELTDTEEKTVQRTVYEWNESGLVSAITDPLGERETFAYDRKGRMTDKWDRDGYHTAYSYDAAGLLTDILYADGEKVSYSYDALRRLRQVRDSAGTTDILTDALGRVARVTDPDGNSTGYEWGSMGEKLRLIYPDGKEAAYRYNGKGQLITLDTEKGAIRYAYDERGHLAEKTFPDGTATHYSYTAAGQPEMIRHRGRGFEEEYRYLYDRAGNKTEVRKSRMGVETDSGTFRYSYDPLNRLTGVEKDGRMLRSYAYDAFGNRILKEDYSGQAVTGTSYRYNAAGQLTALVSGGEEQTYTYDRRGNVSTVTRGGELVRSFTFDAANRLRLAVERKDGREKWAEYTYDAFGNRTGQNLYGRENTVMQPDGTWEDQGPRDPERQIRYTLDVTRHYHNLLKLEEVQGRKDQTFYWDGNVAAMEEDGLESYYLQDDLGSPMQLLDENGEIRESYGFDEFGMSLFPEEDPGHPVQPFGYTGYQMEEAGGVYYAQARRYDAGTGRFVSEDKIAGAVTVPYTLNRYVYCWNNALVLVDLDGLRPATAAEGLEAHRALERYLHATVPGVSYEVHIPHSSARGNTGSADIVYVHGEVAEIYEIKPGSYAAPGSDRNASGHAQLQRYLNHYTEYDNDHNPVRGTSLNPTIAVTTLDSKLHPDKLIKYYVYPSDPGMVYWNYVNRPREKEVVVVPVPEEKFEIEGVMEGVGEDVAETALAAVLLVALYEVAKWATATVLAPATGGLSYGAAACIP